SIDLMERAAGTCTDWLLDKYGVENRYVIFCGNGNNGGDGLAIARQLSAAGANADALPPRVSENDSPDFSANLKQLPAAVTVTELHGAEKVGLPAGNFIIVDAIFGSGLSREPSGLAAEVIDAINRAGAPVVAVDIPSGLFGD